MLLLSAAALVSPVLITPPSVVLLFKNTVVALVCTKAKHAAILCDKETSAPL